jgi:hypothetical protein
MLCDKDASSWLNVMSLFCGRGKNSIKNLCLNLAKDLQPINPLKIRKVNNINFPLGVPEGYKFTDYFAFNRPYLRCWDTGRECGSGTGVDKPNLLSNLGARVAIVGAGRPSESCTFGGGQGATSTKTSVAFPGLYDANWLNKLETGLAAYSAAADAYAAASSAADKKLNVSAIRGALTGISDMLGTAVEVLEMGDRQDMAEPITSWSELKQYQMRATRDFGINCIAKNEMLFKQGSGEDMLLGKLGAGAQRLSPDNSAVTGTISKVLSYNRYDTMTWPKGWRGYITDGATARRFPNFGSDLGGFDINGKAKDLAAYIGLEAAGELDTGSKAPGQYVGLNEAKRGDILLYDKDVVLTGDRKVGEQSKWRLPYVALVTDTSLTSGNTGGLDPTSQLSSVIAPGIKDQWVSVIAYNHGKFPDACGNTDDWANGQQFKIYQSTLPKSRVDLITAYTSSFSPTATIPATYTTSCDDPKNSACIEQNWATVKRYAIREDHRSLNLAGIVTQFCDYFPDKCAAAGNAVTKTLEETLGDSQAGSAADDAQSDWDQVFTATVESQNANVDCQEASVPTDIQTKCDADGGKVYLATQNSDVQPATMSAGGITVNGYRANLTCLATCSKDQLYQDPGTAPTPAPAPGTAPAPAPTTSTCQPSVVVAASSDQLISNIYNSAGNCPGSGDTWIQAWLSQCAASGGNSINVATVCSSAGVPNCMVDCYKPSTASTVPAPAPITPDPITTPATLPWSIQRASTCSGTACTTSGVCHTSNFPDSATKCLNDGGALSSVFVSGTPNDAICKLDCR